MSKKDKKEDGKKLSEKFNLRAKPGQVIPYSQADKPLRKRMKKAMSPLNEKPLDDKTIESYAWRPVAKLHRSAARTGSLRERYQKVRENFFSALGNLNTGNMADIAKETLVTLDRLQNEARRIDRQRRDAAREIGIHVGAAEKISKKYNGKFVRKPLAKFAKKQDAKSRQKLLKALAAGEAFNDRASVLGAQRMIAKVLRHHMQGLRKEIRSQRNATAIIAEQIERVQGTLEQSQQEWREVLKAAGAARPGKSGPQA